MDIGQPKIIYDNNKNIVLDGTLKDHIEILQNLNAKLNNYISTQEDMKANVGVRLDKLEKGGLNTAIDTLPHRYEVKI